MAQFNQAVSDFEIMRCGQPPIITTVGPFNCLNTCVAGSGITGILSMSTDCNALARSIECFESNRGQCTDEFSQLGYAQAVSRFQELECESRAPVTTPAPPFDCFATCLQGINIGTDSCEELLRNVQCYNDNRDQPSCGTSTASLFYGIVSNHYNNNCV